MKKKNNKTGWLLSRKRLIALFGVFSLVLLLLCVRTGYIQIVKGDEYSKMADAQQVNDEVVDAKRGDITDRNGQVLAQSTKCYSVWIRPSGLEMNDTEQDNVGAKDYVTEQLTEILKLDEEESAELRAELDSDKNQIKVAKHLERDTADRIREAELTAVSITEETKRSYPLGDFASHLLGSVTEDNNGLSGLERYYDKYLSGVAGRWIKDTDSDGNTLSYGEETYYEPEDGATLTLTLDEVIQEYTEKAVNSTMKKTDADRVSALVMDPETGEVLAMASTPSFDPNNSREPGNDISEDEFYSMSSSKQLKYLNDRWRNPLINDVYEPGSTFKLITTSAALEENLTNTNEHFACSGSINVQGTTIRCWIAPGSHGGENLVEAVGNSCNPVFVQLARRIGMTKFYDYLDLFGITDVAGIDYPGEATAILQDEKTAGEVGLSTMGFGQGIAVTPIQLLTAVNAIGNEGVIMQPHIMKKITSADGEVISENKPEKVRQAVSKKTVNTVKEIMQYVVEEGGAENAMIEGYEVGGKTGTAEKYGSEKGQVVGSFVGLAPIDDPQISVLLIVDNPRNGTYGSDVAAPGAKQIMEKTLKYLNIQPTKEKGQDTGLKTVPDVTEKSAARARQILENRGFKYKDSPADHKNKDYKVKDQYPKAGSSLKKGGTVYIYGE